MYTMFFEAHGTYHISRSGRVIISIPVGPNNIESFREYVRDFKRMAEPLLNGPPWAVLLIGLKDQLTSPEVEKIMSDFSQWREKNNCRYIAWSMQYVQKGKGVIHHQWVRIYQKTQTTEIIFFEKTEEGLRWLKKKGYPCLLQQEELLFIENNKIV